MSRPAWNPTPIQSGQQGWDATVNDNVNDGKGVILGGPMPLHQHAGDESDLEATYPAAQHDRCLIWVQHTTLGWTLYYSDGTTWRTLARNVNQVASVAATVADLRTDFNALLTKLRGVGVLGTPTP